MFVVGGLLVIGRDRSESASVFRVATGGGVVGVVGVVEVVAASGTNAPDDGRGCVVLCFPSGRDCVR